MLLIKKIGQSTSEAYDIIPQFLPNLKTFHLFKLLNTIFRSAQDLPEFKNLFYKVEEEIQTENGFEKKEFKLTPVLPCLSDYKKLIMHAIELVRMDNEEITLVLSFARSKKDQMLLSEQIENLKTGHILHAIKKVMSYFIDTLTAEGVPEPVHMNDLKKELLQNLKNGSPLSFLECLQVAGLSSLS